MNKVGFVDITWMIEVMSSSGRTFEISVTIVPVVDRKTATSQVNLLHCAIESLGRVYEVRNSARRYRLGLALHGTDHNHGHLLVIFTGKHHVMPSTSAIGK
jgi:hypothetical protein